MTTNFTNNLILFITMKQILSFFWRTITTDFLKFNGRLTRRDFWFFVLCYYIFGAVTCGIGYVWGMIPYLNVAVRRLNDAGHSWKALLWSLLCGIGGLVTLYLAGFKPSQEGANAHGEPVESQC